ncbi:methyl-accepting chemotaxis protein [Novosphingobium taihuense]|uniref:Methyl-accepting chemotaxis protein n=1 Tax=Novosphingobium taihuense TaxID=260085 RepID=A0A7W7A7R8_9SPHN|nr:methyl-accepting chemotaxis protein [Novosphingobium taihuense]MBB4611994.1 methyl-accepting chemotaxis protein [Novosphingobium taihuense]TWH88653.1 methyl-accepting chemotaxis protein [Novosphingobium taihuense]
MEQLQVLRANGLRALAFTSIVGTLIIFIGAIWADSGLLPPIAASLAALLTVYVAMSGSSDATARCAVAAGVMTFPMILLYQWAGSAWMIDLHMVFFACLAIIVVLADWRPIVTGAALTAVHHLLGNLVAPELVYGTGGDLLRVVLHAVVVIAETAALVFLSVQLQTLVITQAEAEATKLAMEEAAAGERQRIAEEQELVISAIEQRLEELAAGDLSTMINADFPPAYLKLKSSFNAATADLDRLVGAVSSTTIHIAQGSSEIRSASDDLARRTELQASALEQNNLVTCELVKEIDQTAREAGHTREAISQAQEFAETGGAVVSSAVSAMNEIERSSNEIGQIISLIDGIAFQTNLLALNAGVEAARAGDAGKGFAVVANEVRALAQRSAEAASSIRTLIQTSSVQVAAGVSLVGKTGTVLGDIVSRVSQVSEAISDIADSAVRQSGELTRVSGSFGNLDTLTQQNAAMVEESNAAAHQLARAAEELRELVSRFRTSRSDASLDRPVAMLRVA